MAQIEGMELVDSTDMEFTLKRTLLAKSKRAIIVRSPAGTEYRCVECPLGFTDKGEMERHLGVHNKEYRFLCGICGTALKRKEHLDRHTLEHKEVRPHICPDCGKGFKRKEHLNIHRTIHSGEKNHICPLCEKSFYRKDHLQKHLQTHNKMFMEQNIYPVSDQELLGIKQEVTDEEPTEEMEVVEPVPDRLFDPERPHPCPVCHKRFKRKDHLKLHSVSHLARDKFCPHCDKAFRTEEQLHGHMSTHVKPESPAPSEELYLMEEEYPQEYQQEEDEDSLLIPRVSLAEDSARPHSCQQCGRRFKRKQHLKVHANVHARRQPPTIWCSICSEVSLAEAGARLHSCVQCGRRVKRKQHLKVHANVHARRQPPTIWCSICSEGFFSNSQFESHECMGAEPDEPPRANQENSYPQDVVEIMNVPIVTEEPDLPGLPVPRRVFVCRYCGKPFKRKDHYRIHLHVHTGVKSFFCEECGKGFYRKDHLQKHSQVHSKMKTTVRKPKKAMPELFPIHMLPKKTDAPFKPEITITAPSNAKLRVPLQIKVPYQVVTSMANGEQEITTVDPRELLS